MTDEQGIVMSQYVIEITNKDPPWWFRITLDGNAEHSPGYEPNEAARMFLAAMAQQWPVLAKRLADESCRLSIETLARERDDALRRAGELRLTIALHEQTVHTLCAQRHELAGALVSLLAAIETGDDDTISAACGQATAALVGNGG